MALFDFLDFDQPLFQGTAEQPSLFADLLSNLAYTPKAPNPAEDVMDPPGWYEQAPDLFNMPQNMPEAPQANAPPMMLDPYQSAMPKPVESMATPGMQDQPTLNEFGIPQPYRSTDRQFSPQFHDRWGSLFGRRFG